MGEVLGVTVVVSLALIIPWFCQHAFVRNRLKPLQISIWTVWAALSGLVGYLSSQTPGWDGLGYSIFLIFVAAPAGIGLIGGEISGRYVRAKMQKA